MKDGKEFMRENEWRKYLLCVLLVGTLIAAAVWFPAVILDWMDGQIQKDYVLQNRQGIDYAASTLYSNNVGNRLNSVAGDFAEGKHYDTISSELDLNEEQRDEALKRIQGQYVYSFYYSFLSFIKGYSLAEYEMLNCANLVMYDVDSINGTPLLCQYYELQMLDYKLRFLVDATDAVIYYLEVYSPASNWYYLMDWDLDNNVDDLYEFVYQAYDVSLEYYGIPIENYESILQQEEEERAVFFEENGISLSRLSKSTPYSYYYENGFLVNTFSHFYQQRNEDSWIGGLPFQDGNLNFCIHYAQPEGDLPYHGICAGIQELEELLPEDFRGVRAE